LELFPDDPVSRTDREALSALLKTVDLYALDVSTRAPFDPSKLAILRGTAPPRELGDRLSGELLHSYLNFETVIEKSQDEVEAMLSDGTFTLPTRYWDPELEAFHSTRVEFFKNLCSLKLGGYRLSARGKMGIFFVRKKTGMIRMVLDCRYTTTCIGCRLTCGWGARPRLAL
jgi:hypothetical protein